MTAEQLKRKNPALYKEALEAGFKEGVQEERKRILSLSSWATSRGSQNQHMDRIIAAAVKEAIASGAGSEPVIAAVKIERQRVASLKKWSERDAGNEKLASLVQEAIASGKTEADVMPQLTVAFFKYGSRAEDAADPDVKKVQAVLAKLQKKFGPATGEYDHVKLSAKDRAEVRRVLARWDDAQLNKIVGQHGDKEYRHAFEN